MNREFEDYPPGEHDDQTDAVPNVDKMIRRFWLTRLAYRIPTYLLELFLILATTLVVPVAAGALIVAGMEIVQGDYALPVRLLGFWLLGAVTIGGVGIWAIVVYSLWSGIWGSTKRLWTLFRRKK